MSILERSFPRIARRSGGRLAGLLVAATLALAGVAAVAPSEASATTMVYADVKRLVAISDVVVHGVVESRRVFYGDHDRITTEWSIVVKDAWKGGFAERVLVRQWAGELDGESMRIPGDASFREGEEVVLFLKGDRPEQMYLSAMGQAKFSVHRRLFPDVPMPPASAGGALIISLPSHLSASSNGTALV